MPLVYTQDQLWALSLHSNTQKGKEGRAPGARTTGEPGYGGHAMQAGGKSHALLAVLP